MTKIGADASSVLPQSQTGPSKLKIGAELVVGVKGPTRHGLIVRVGRDSFILNARAALQDAESLTLKIAERTSTTDHKVQILASDGRPLAKPIQGELAARAPAPTIQSAPPTITEGHQIEVNARPVATDGRQLGPLVTVRLATTRPSASTSTGSELGQSGGGKVAASLPNTSTTGKLAEAPLPSRSAPPSLIPSASSSQTAEPAVPNSTPKTGLSLSSSSLQASPATSPPQRPSAAANATLPIDAVSKPASSIGVASNGSQSMGYPSLDDASKHASSPKTIIAQPLAPNDDRQDVMRVTVIGRAPDSGKLLLQAGSDLLMKIEQPIDLPIGSTLHMTLMTGPVNAAQLEEIGSPTNQAGLLTKLVALLEDIEQSGGTSGGHREPATGRQLPMPDRHLASKLLGLMGLPSGAGTEDAGMIAQQRDSADSWSTHQLKSLLTDIAKTASESLVEGWRSTNLPLGPDPAQAIMIHCREHHPEHQSDGDQADTEDVTAQRAVFDINFSRLGRCQIDALCQEQRFDLLVRSEKALDHEHQQEITTLFSSACEIAGLTGEIGFRHGQFVEPALTSRSTKTVTT